MLETGLGAQSLHQQDLTHLEFMRDQVERQKTLVQETREEQAAISLRLKEEEQRLKDLEAGFRNGKRAADATLSAAMLEVACSQRPTTTRASTAAEPSNESQQPVLFGFNNGMLTEY